MRFVLMGVLIAALLAPAKAIAQSAPFQPLPQAPAPAPEPVTADPGADAGGISSLQQTLLIAGGVLFVLGIGVAIARDARRNAPAETRPARGGSAAGTPGEGVGERRKPDPRAVQKQKAAAKRAREARKRNRPVRK